MKKLSLLILLAVVFYSCKNNPFQKFYSNPAVETDTVALDFSPVDTLALTLEALDNKRLPDGYKKLDSVKVAILTYTGFHVDDVKCYVFEDEAGNEISFSGNDTQFHLIIKSNTPNEENGGFDPNPQYLNKKFQVFWRRIQLDRRPQTETELYYQEYDEIIFLKMMPIEITFGDSVKTKKNKNIKQEQP